jgi:membrane protease YdiL (CAAX protease family)
MSNTSSQSGRGYLSGSDYWVQSRQPLTSLVFITPILLFYEGGVVLLGPRAVRNGADVWLRGLLDLMDFGQYFLLPILTVGILLAWHHTTRRPWRVSRGVLSGMVVESVLLAIALRLILQLEILVWPGLSGPAAALAQQGPPAFGGSAALAGLIAFLGAGIYEELLFRLILLSLLAWAARRAGAGERAGTAAAVLAASLVFSVAHYVGPYGEPVLWLHWSFWFAAVFRLLAGIFFSLLFVYRGFGIAVGAHAGYDVLVKLL